MTDCTPCEILYDVPSVEQVAAMPKCEQLLADAMAAYHKLMTGAQEVEIKYRDHSLKYTAATMTGLKQYISGLNAQCPNVMATAMIGKRSARSVQFGNCRGVGCY